MSEPERLHMPTPLVDTPTNALASRESFPGTSLKRPASSSFEGWEEETSRKRRKEESESVQEDVQERNDAPPVISASLADDLAQDLQCGCCSELVYRPVIVNPCQHFFCGSCCVLWIRNGGTNCPACRGVSTVVTPFRALQSVIDTLLRAAPHKARTERERQQADEIYKVGTSMRIPSPREPSPEANVDPPSDYARPCPHCMAGNPYGWRCPQPIPDPTTDIEHAWHLEDGVPPGHAHCGNCENLLATRAPTTTKCDLCQVYFCGIGIQGRCLAAPLLAQHPHGLSDVPDLILSADVYECFDSNNVEVEIMLDYLTAQRLTPRHIYREIVTHIQSQPRGFKPLMELELFSDLHGVAGGTDPDPDAPRNNICRHCAAEVFLWGLREWWVRERQKGFLEERVMNRKDCPEGRACDRQMDLAHAKEFNHIIPSSEPRRADPASEPQPEVPTAPVTPIEPNPTEQIELPAVSGPPTHPLWALFARASPTLPREPDSSELA
ncbi:putative ring finger [Lyophyllum shimeji]|uniref:Ring finger n=1 Tax=Lyophyllum shimeji TaxID=47721 RepID=A0A9P3UMC7_LYOSH|nr:putative ring finger [Lyophyllum shimeji]